VVILKLILEKKNGMRGLDFSVRIGKIVDVGESNNEIFSSIKYAAILTRDGT
jgi:hypothetical protein